MLPIAEGLQCHLSLTTPLYDLVRNIRGRCSRWSPQGYDWDCIKGIRNPIWWHFAYASLHDRTSLALWQWTEWIGSSLSIMEISWDEEEFRANEWEIINVLLVHPREDWELRAWTESTNKGTAIEEELNVAWDAFRTFNFEINDTLWPSTRVVGNCKWTQQNNEWQICNGPSPWTGIPPISWVIPSKQTISSRKKGEVTWTL